MATLTVHVFGIYDSRGGTLAVEAHSIEGAIKRAAAEFFAQIPPEPHLDPGLRDAYLGEATLEGWEEGLAGELEADWGGPGEVLAGAFGWFPTQPPLRFVPTGECRPAGWTHPRWHDDGWGFWLLPLVGSRPASPLISP